MNAGDLKLNTDEKHRKNNFETHFKSSGVAQRVGVGRACDCKAERERVCVCVCVFGSSRLCEAHEPSFDRLDAACGCACCHHHHPRHRHQRAVAARLDLFATRTAPFFLLLDLLASYDAKL